MKFIITRTSLHRDNEPPCDGAERVMRRLPPQEDGSFWTRPSWVVEVADLDELLKFVDEYDRVIITRTLDCDGDPDAYPWEIEIYDDYRE